MLDLHAYCENYNFIRELTSCNLKSEPGPWLCYDAPPSLVLFPSSVSSVAVAVIDVKLLVRSRRITRERGGGERPPAREGGSTLSSYRASRERNGLTNFPDIHPGKYMHAPKPENFLYCGAT